MKSKNDSLIQIGGVRLIKWCEDKIERFLISIDRTTRKQQHKSKKQLKHKKLKQELMEKGRQDDAEITVAEYLGKKQDKTNLVKTRVLESNRDNSYKEIEK